MRPATVSRSVVWDGARSGVFMRQRPAASAAAPANGPAANEPQPPRYWLRTAPRIYPVLGATHRVGIYEMGSSTPPDDLPGPCGPSDAMAKIVW